MSVTRRALKRGSALTTCGALLVACVGLAQAETASEAAKRPVVGPKPARLADGHPNWTGFWVPTMGMLENNFGLGGVPAGPPGAIGKPVELPPSPAPGDAPPGPDAAPPGPGSAPPGASGAPPGHGGPPPGPGGKPGGPPPGPSMPFVHFSALKEPYKSELDKFMRVAMTGKVGDPVASCFPPGMPRMMSMVYGMEFLQTPGQIAITSEWQAASRRVWLAQKSHTPADELDPTYAGESIGHWEGDTLVVDTVGIRKDVPLNFTGLPHSDKLRVIERFTQTKPGILVDEVTVDDPDVFVAPWKEIETYRYRPDLRIEEYVCLENNRNVGEHGEAVFTK